MKHRNIIAGFVAAAAVAGLIVVPARASDHADPVNSPFSFATPPADAGITDLFAFPDHDARELVLIFCVHPALTVKQEGDLRISSYTYSIKIDLNSRVLHAYDPRAAWPPLKEKLKTDKDPKKRLTEQDWARQAPAYFEERNFRYGGAVEKPDQIAEDLTIEFELNNDGTPKTGYPRFIPLKQRGGTDRARQFNFEEAGKRMISWHTAEKPELHAVPSSLNGTTVDPSKINIWTGITDDPFIFPGFYGTNVVTMVVTLPMDLFPADQQDWILWGATSKAGKQLDHVGRSLRTQNPRFDGLNALHPSKHAAAVLEEHTNPSLQRDIFVRLGISGLFSFRTWDQDQPDVMLFTRTPGISFASHELDGGSDVVSDGKTASFPNGRYLTDDVAQRLARWGDIVLWENSYIQGGWPRSTVNDIKFQGEKDTRDVTATLVFPYLGDKHQESPVKPKPMLSLGNQMLLIAVGIGILLFWVLTAIVLALWIDYRRRRQRFV